MEIEEGVYENRCIVCKEKYKSSKKHSYKCSNCLKSKENYSFKVSKRKIKELFGVKSEFHKKIIGRK